MQDVEFTLGVSHQAHSQDVLHTLTRNLSDPSRRTANYVRREHSELVRCCPIIRGVYDEVGITWQQP